MTFTVFRSHPNFASRGTVTHTVTTHTNTLKYCQSTKCYASNKLK